MGKSTIAPSYTITPTGPNTFSIQGTSTIVAANGDTLFTTFTGTGESSGAFAVGQTSVATLAVTITGGTGRFAGASGAYTQTVSSEVLSITFPTATLHQINRSRGTISY